MSIYIENAGAKIGEGIRDGLESIAKKMTESKCGGCHHIWGEPYKYMVSDGGDGYMSEIYWIVQKCDKCSLVRRISEDVV